MLLRSKRRSHARESLSIFVALSLLVPNQLLAQTGRAERPSNVTQVQSSPLNKRDVDQLRAAGKVPGARVLLVAKVDRVERIPTARDSSA